MGAYQSIITVRGCPVCRAVDGWRIHQQRFILPEGHPLPRAYAVVGCRECGFIYADTAKTAADYARYYAAMSKYESHEIGTGGGQDAHDRYRLSGMGDALAGMVPWRDRPVIDIGCGMGGLLDRLRDHGFSSLMGCDPSPACARAVSSRGHVGICDTLEGDAWDGQYGLVILSHVLEHVLHLRAAVAMVASRVADGCAVYVEVPDAAHYGDHPVVPYYYFDTEHINHFEIATLVRLWHDAGFRLASWGEKDLIVGEAQRYPAVYGLFVKDAVPTQAVIPPQRALASVEAHLAASRAQSALPDITRLADQRASVIIWGAGNHAMRLLAVSDLSRCDILFFVDKDVGKQGTQLEGRTIHPPHVLFGRTEPIVVCAALHGPAIEREIRSMGLANAVHLC